MGFLKRFFETSRYHVDVRIPQIQTTVVDLGNCVLSFDGMVGQGNLKSFCKSHSDEITNNRAHNKIKNIFLNNQDRNKRYIPLLPPRGCASTSYLSVKSVWTARLLMTERPEDYCHPNWVVVSGLKYCCFFILFLGNRSNLTNIFFRYVETTNQLIIILRVP